MSTDIPLFKKILIHLSTPFKYEILLLAYISLVTSILLLLMAFCWTFILILGKIVFRPPMVIIALTVEILIILLLDIVFNLVLIIGALKKHTTLLLFYYRYRIPREFVFTASVLLYTYIVYKVAPGNNPYEESNLWPVTLNFLLSSTFFHTYLLILVRSEVLKLKAISQFKLSHHTADPTCVMQGSDDV